MKLEAIIEKEKDELHLLNEIIDKSGEMLEKIREKDENYAERIHEIQQQIGEIRLHHQLHASHMQSEGSEDALEEEEKKKHFFERRQHIIEAIQHHILELQIHEGHLLHAKTLEIEKNELKKTIREAIELSKEFEEKLDEHQQLLDQERLQRSQHISMSGPANRPPPAAEDEEEK